MGDLGLSIGDEMADGFVVTVANVRSTRRAGAHGWFECQRPVGRGVVTFSSSSEGGLRGKVDAWLEEQAKRKDGGVVADPRGVAVLARGGQGVPAPVEVPPVDDGKVAA